MAFFSMDHYTKPKFLRKLTKVNGKRRILKFPETEKQKDPFPEERIF
ncbi:hypothetical protein HMPREF9413_1365 [Paenibacillus sp. HGF7]|nr:hypothetical protein HMPREF9413_1365 [Paenibacillus sp. HGF7]